MPLFSLLLQAASEPSSLAGLGNRPERKGERKPKAGEASRQGSLTSKQTIEDSSWSLLNSFVSGSDASQSHVNSATPAPSFDLPSSTDGSIDFSPGPVPPLSDLRADPHNSVAVPSSRQVTQKVIGSSSMCSEGRSTSPINGPGPTTNSINDQICSPASSNASPRVKKSPSYPTRQSFRRATPRQNKSPGSHQSELLLASCAVYNPLYSCYPEQRPKLISVHTQTVGWETDVADYPTIIPPSYPVTVLDEEGALGSGDDYGSFCKPQLTAAATFSYSDTRTTNTARPQRRHTYVNLVDDFDSKVKHLGQW
ncbi:unnamed protein product [Schistocephalus solidus]|uniref:C2H2-type domain-containing protein n=1 Tax=Schistocephalus solidus TaxID=70667 RepID=A0A183SGK8_SCHSO|nr:unnamed protein product [Schistocephalus solidus]